MAIGDINLNTGALAQQSNLVNTLENWKSQNLRKVQEASAAIGASEAKKDLNSDDGGEFVSNFGVSNKAYNSTLAQGYIQSAKTSLSEELSAIAAENPNDLQAYNDLSEQAKRSAVQNADPYISDELALEADLIISSYRKQVQGNSIKLGTKAAKEEVDNSIRIKTDNALGMLANATNDEDIQGAALQMTEAMSLIQGQVESGEITETQGAFKK